MLELKNLTEDTPVENLHNWAFVVRPPRKSKEVESIIYSDEKESCYLNLIHQCAELKSKRRNFDLYVRFPKKCTSKDADKWVASFLTSMSVGYNMVAGGQAMCDINHHLYGEGLKVSTARPKSMIIGIMSLRRVFEDPNYLPTFNAVMNLGYNFYQSFKVAHVATLKGDKLLPNTFKPNHQPFSRRANDHNLNGDWMYSSSLNTGNCGWSDFMKDPKVKDGWSSNYYTKEAWKPATADGIEFTDDAIRSILQHLRGV